MDQPKTAGNSPNIRFRPKGWKETALIMLVFAITGTTSMRLTRPALTHVLGLEGTLYDCTKSAIRICELCVVLLK
jgi:hypothetical protein